MAATTAASLRVSSLKAEQLSSKSSVGGVRAAAPKPAVAPKAVTVCSVEGADISRRSAAALIAVAAAAAASSSSPALAAYGDRANVFGKASSGTGFASYSGDGFKIALPGKFNPSKEVDFPGTVLRYEDNFDAVSNVVVTKNPTTKGSISDFGSPEKFLADNSFYLGTQAYNEESKSEGGFAPGRFARAHVLDTSTVKDSAGNTYFLIDVIVTSADGDEGGRHHVFKAGVKGGNLYVCKFQSGDKRWFKGQDRIIRSSIETFSLA